MTSQCFRVGNGAVSNPCAAQDQYVCLSDRIVGGTNAVHADHPKSTGIIRLKGANSHQRCDNRNIGFMYKVAQRLFRLADEDTAAGNNQRAFCFGNCRGRFVDLADMALETGPIGADGDFFRIGKIYFHLLYIHRNVNQYRTWTSSPGNIKRFFKNPSDIFRVLDQITVFDKSFNRTGNVNFLKNIASQQRGNDLAGNNNHRNRIHISGRYSGNQVGCTRTGGNDTDSGFAGHSGITVGCVSGVLLGTNQHMPDVRAGQRVIKRTDRRSRIAKDRFDTFCFQTADHRFTDGCNHGLHLLEDYSCMTI